jgi:two-component system sensor histidine kinase KdpD
MLEKLKIYLKDCILFSWRDWWKTVLIMTFAYIVSRILLIFSGEEDNSGIIHLLAVVIVSRVTTGYFYGVIASVISIFSTNYFFTYPFSALNFSITGYPLVFASMLAASITVCALTTQIKNQAEAARESERRTKELYKINQRLEREKTKIRMEAEKEKLRNDLLRAVSHDLRTPLTTILGASSVLLEGGENLDESERRKLVSDIKEDSEWLIRMIENLLSITRISAHSAKIKKEPEIVEEIVGEAIVKIKKSYPGSKIAVSVPERPLIVSMDAILIEQVIINLLENAIRHSGDKENIKLRCYEDNTHAIFEISDRGKGLTEAEISRIWEGRDFTSDTSADSTRGLGIGLSVCKSIIKVHNGFIKAENNMEAGSGLVFTFGLSFEEGSDETKA